VTWGALAGLARWPVKSMAGERLRAARLNARGVGGDRTHALLPASDHRAVEVELDWPPEPGYAWGRSNQVW
jgi:uncharacterized protein YcbX